MRGSFAGQGAAQLRPQPGEARGQALRRLRQRLKGSGLQGCKVQGDFRVSNFQGFRRTRV